MAKTNWETITVDVEIAAICAQCGNPLEIEEIKNDHEKIKVEPCQTCLDNEYKEGKLHKEEENNG